MADSSKQPQNQEDTDPHKQKVDEILEETLEERIHQYMERARKSVEDLKEKKQQLEVEAAFTKKKLSHTEQLLSFLERVDEDSIKGTLTINSLTSMFKDVKEKFPDEYVRFRTTMCIHAVPLVAKTLRGMDPLRSPYYGLPLVKTWKILLGGGLLYTYFCREAIVPAISASTNTWDPMFPKPFIRFLDLWKDHLPDPIYEAVLEQLVLPKIVKAIEKWDPCRTTIALEVWVLPWERLLASRMERIYNTIRNRVVELDAGPSGTGGD